MNDFEKRLKAARSAGWMVCLICFLGLLIEWGVYLAVMKCQPQWFLDLCGAGMTWETLRVIWGGAVIHLKYGFWFFLLVLIWLELWDRRLKA